MGAEDMSTPDRGQREYDVLMVARSEIMEAAARLGLSQFRAFALADSVEERLRRDLGGGWWYVPAVDLSEHRRQRNAAICEESAAGENDCTLARRYQLHPDTIRKIRAAGR
jgi:Mor family transcriptional regulator